VYFQKILCCMIFCHEHGNEISYAGDAAAAPAAAPAPAAGKDYSDDDEGGSDYTDQDEGVEGADYADDNNYMVGARDKTKDEKSGKAGHDYSSGDNNYMLSNFPPGVPHGPDCDKRPDGKCA
jgi:hypothetical protein